MREVVAGIDIGGTNIKIGLVNAEGEVLWRSTVSTNQYPTPQILAEELHQLLLPVLNSHNYTLKGIGIGAPNGNFYKGTIEFAPNLLWEGVIYLTEIFQSVFKVPCLLTNDANAAALGEMLFGGAKGMKDFIFITLGTGLGSGIIANGKLVYGHDGFAGEMGHIIVKPEGRVCGCGRKGCLETYCSAPGLVKTYLELLSSSELQQNITAKEVFDKAVSGDKEANEAITFTGEILGKALAMAVHFTSPEAIFLFGGLAHAGDRLFLPVIENMEKELLPIYRNKVKIIHSALPQDDAAILGAASLIWQE
ncbi:MAG: ROK family protein [Flavobacteriales bacterium]|nr:ROK family protein [Flavobacteriales bacterium]